MWPIASPRFSPARMGDKFEMRSSRDGSDEMITHCEVQKIVKREGRLVERELEWRLLIEIDEICSSGFWWLVSVEVFFKYIAEIGSTWSFWNSYVDSKELWQWGGLAPQNLHHCRSNLCDDSRHVDVEKFSAGQGRVRKNLQDFCCQNWSHTSPLHYGHF